MKIGDNIVWSSSGRESWIGRTGVIVGSTWDNNGQWIDIRFDDTMEISEGWSANRVDKYTNNAG